MSENRSVNRSRSCTSGDNEEKLDPKKVKQYLEIILLCCRSVFQTLKLPKRDFLIEHLLFVGQIVMIFAPAGVGKTWLALLLAIALSRGGELFGPYRVSKAVGVMYVDGEMPASEMQSRINSLARAPDPELFRVISSDVLSLKNLEVPNLADKNWREAIFGFLKENPQYRVLILDNLSALTPGCDELTRIDYDPINQWLMRLRRLGVTAILIHHAGKSGDQRGTSAREDQMDLVLSLTREKNAKGLGFRVEFKKARSLFGNQQKPFVVELRENGDGKLEAVHRDTGKHPLGDVALLASQGMKQKDIADKLMISQGEVSKRLRKAIEDGIIKEHGELTEKGKVVCAESAYWVG